MANYDTLPATLAALFGVKDYPQGTEPVSVVDDYLRQTRNWLYDFLSLYVDPSTGKIKPSAFATDGSLPAGVVRGTNPVNNAGREIVQGSILGVDLADATVTGAKIGTGTITNTNIADGTIQAGKLADGTVTAAKIAAGVFATSNIADLAVTGAKMANATVTSDKLADLAVSESKLAARAVLGRALPLALENQMLIGGNGVDGKDFAPKTLTGAFTVDKDGVTRLTAGLAGSQVTFARLQENVPNGVTPGTLDNNGWTYRGGGTAPSWSIVSTTRLFIEVSAPNVRFLEGGKYLIRVTCPVVCDTGNKKHQCRLVYFPNPGLGPLIGAQVYYGTSVDGAQAVQTETHLEVVLDVSDTLAETPGLRPFFYVQHYMNGTGNNRFGLPCSASSLAPATVAPPEVFGEISILRIQETI